jgi:hypothetical protein
MIEALARIRNDSILSRPAKKSVRGRGVVLRLADRARALPPRFYIGAILSALLAGIGVNALILQRERHPAPLFAPAPPKIVAPPPVAPPPTPPPAVARETPAPVATTPRPLPQVSGAQRASDPIGDLLRGESPAADDAHLIVAAQAALARLGYSVKADGAQGAATDQALRDFERAHGLPNATEITPHLVKQLATAARAAAR